LSFSWATNQPPEYFLNILVDNTLTSKPYSWKPYFSIVFLLRIFYAFPTSITCATRLAKIFLIMSDKEQKAGIPGYSVFFYVLVHISQSSKRKQWSVKPAEKGDHSNW
jgi:hypothetical protein